MARHNAFSGLVALASLVAAYPAPALAQQPPARTYVFVHGAWGGGWDWRRVDSLLTQRGHTVYRASLTGLGERVHLASPGIGLSTHIDDVVNTLLWEDLRDVVLVGHSYGGMVITGVADRIPERIHHLVYVDAFLPDSGESVLSLSTPEFAAFLREGGEGGFIRPMWVRAEDSIPKDVPHPLKTFTDTLRLVNPAARRVPGTYILTVDPGATEDSFQRYAGRATARGWTVRQMAADHVPERSAPGALVELLLAIPAAAAAR